jgi:hypothetical protein
MPPLPYSFGHGRDWHRGNIGRGWRLPEWLGAVLGHRLDRGPERRCWPRRAAKLANSCKDYPPMSQEDADVLEVLIGQMG